MRFDVKIFMRFALANCSDGFNSDFFGISVHSVLFPQNGVNSIPIPKFAVGTSSVPVPFQFIVFSNSFRVLSHPWRPFQGVVGKKVLVVFKLFRAYA